MELIWSKNAENSFLETLDFWYEHNGSYEYPQKIIRETEKAIEEIKKYPYSVRYLAELGLYKRAIMKGKFSLYYEIREDETIIELLYFRSSKQQPLEENISFK
ncbi:type II toxin-antitoxin system RelE/ParE family toxin [Fusobacterium nucleatum]|jgi:plasmid stabilization system protein, relE/parE family|uniref:type II toxin-antitoxin system RelE/ParE family toxin n=1 Tax=Capnocytophaga gingivalis TaxID=1017 RepID=UPI0023F64E09|nr:type II toxin-antitoxin system RelE/ParE family toxin [Capnocytophaga gingivalis]